MEKVILYSTGCPRCNVLKKKLDVAAIQYEVNSNEETMTELGFQFLPILEVNGKYFEFSDAIDWIKERNNGN